MSESLSVSGPVSVSVSVSGPVSVSVSVSGPVSVSVSVSGPVYVSGPVSVSVSVFLSVSLSVSLSASVSFSCQCLCPCLCLCPRDRESKMERERERSEREAQAMRHAGQANEVCGVRAGTCAEKGYFRVTLRPTTISSRSLPLSVPLSRTPKLVFRGLRGAECIYVPTGMLLIDRKTDSAKLTLNDVEVQVEQCLETGTPEAASMAAAHNLSAPSLPLRPFLLP